MADNANNPGLERTVMDLMETQQRSGIDQTNMLLMLSLVNLMGIVNILHQSAGISNLAEGTMYPQQVPTSTPAVGNQGDLMSLLNQAASGQLDPMQLLAMLNGSGKGVPNGAALMSLLSQMMPPPPPQHQARQCNNEQTKRSLNEASPPTPSTSPTPPKENTSKSEPEQGRERERNNQKNYLKWDPRLG